MHEEEVTLFKCGGECLDEFYVAEGYLTENTNLATCCRTQVRVRLNSPADYFLRNPLGNHHVLIQGHHAELLKAFMLQNRCKQRE
jgi:L-fucose isomerase-like protein